MNEQARRYGQVMALRARAINNGARPEIIRGYTDEARELWLALVQGGAFSDERCTQLKSPYKNAFMEGLHEQAAKEWQE